jgi:hypothetical protein
MAEATAALEAVNKQRADGERQVVAVQNAMQRLRTERAEHETVMADIKAKLYQVQLGEYRP